MKYIAFIFIGLVFVACKNNGISTADITCVKNGVISTYYEQPIMMVDNTFVIMSKEYPMSHIETYQFSSCDYDFTGKVARDEYKFIED